MKKLLIVLLIICTLFTVTAYASPVDFGSMTTDELIDLRDALNVEIANRIGNEDSLIYVGRYVVGEDIKAGRYVINFLSKEDSIDTEYGTVVIYYTEEDDRSMTMNKDVLYFPLGEDGCIELADGNVVYIKEAAASIHSIAKPSWAP